MGLKKIAKKLASCAICGTLLIGTMGMTSFASSPAGSMSGGLKDDIASATVYNRSNSTRYCSVEIRQSNNISYNNRVSYNYGVSSGGNFLGTTGKITMSHARGYGIVYNSQTPTSGTAWSGYTSLK